MKNPTMIAAGMIMMLLGSGAAQAKVKLPESLARMTPTDFRERAELIDDRLAPHLVVSTRPAHEKGLALKGAFADDMHLRAMIDRNTGQVSWRVSQRLIHFRPRLELAAVTYSAGSTPVSTQAFTARQWREHCTGGDYEGACFDYMQVEFDVPEQVLRQIAQAYSAGSREAWPLRFDAVSGKGVTSGIAPAEAAGLLQAVDVWRQSRL